MLDLMAAPIVACIVLMGIHVYLGLHVIQRKVIFVDLALAQIAALGATMGFLMGFDPHGQGSFLFSLGFSVVGAAIFALTRMRREHVPQEAIIGITYVVALACAILVADRAPEGAEHIKETLVGSILWVRWSTIARAAVLFVLVGIVHVLFRKRFLQISFDVDSAYAEGRWVRAWDFVFYLTFAFVITTAVAIAGVLLVFSFLVIPAVIAALFAQRVGPRLTIGWSVGIAGSLVGLTASYKLDLPSGPTVVAALGGALLLGGLAAYVLSADNRWSASLKVLAGLATLTVAIGGLVVIFTHGERLQIDHGHEWETEHTEPAGAAPNEFDWAGTVSRCKEDPACVAAHLRESHDWLLLLAHPLADDDRFALDHLDALLAVADDPGAMDRLAEATTTERDPLLRVAQARILVAVGDGRGLGAALSLLGDETPFVAREEAHDLLLSASGKDFGYDPLADAPANEGPIGRWRSWVASAERVSNTP
jgi:zinc/manganese transport system permease protein